MEENKEEKHSASEAMEESKLSMPEKARHQMENYLSIKEAEEQAKEQELQEALKDINYRRWYYQNELKKYMDRIPREYYYQAEYEQMQVLCEKLTKQMDSLEKIEDFEALLREFRRKTSKKLSANTIVLIVVVTTLVLFIGFLIVVYFINK
jgi:hypothetical protein